MSSDLTSHPDMVNIGPATLCLMNEATDHLVMIGKVTGLTLSRMDPQNVYLSEIINEQEVHVDGKPTFCGFTLSGKLVETLDPSIQHLVMKNCGTPVEEPACGIVTVTEEYRAYRDRAIKLKHSTGFYGTGALPAPASAAATAIVNGAGTFVADDYIVTVTPMYGTSEGAAVDSNTVTVGATDCVMLIITPPAGGAAPDSYRIYARIHTQTRADAYLIQETDAVNLVYTHIHVGTLYPGDQTSAMTITDAAGLSFDPGTDYDVDETCAIVSFYTTAPGGGGIPFVDAGDIENGEKVIITYSYYRNPYVSMSIGPGTMPPFVHPVILALRDDDRAEIRPRGVEIELYKVLASSGWSWDLSTISYEGGFDFTWEALVSPRTLNHGKITTFNRHLSSYSIENLAALTEWNQAENCEETSD